LGWPVSSERSQSHLLARSHPIISSKSPAPNSSRSAARAKSFGLRAASIDTRTRQASRCACRADRTRERARRRAARGHLLARASIDRTSITLEPGANEANRMSRDPEAGRVCVSLDARCAGQADAWQQATLGSPSHVLPHACRAGEKAVATSGWIR
jgi:hypothetical protein